MGKNGIQQFCIFIPVFTGFSDDLFYSTGKVSESGAFCREYCVLHIWGSSLRAVAARLGGHQLSDRSGDEQPVGEGQRYQPQGAAFYCAFL